MRCHRVKIRRIDTSDHMVAKFDWRPWLESASTLIDSVLLKSDAGSWVRSVASPIDPAPTSVSRTSRTDLIIKARRLTLADAIKRLARATRGDRHWKGSIWLRQHEFPTARVFVLAEADLGESRYELLIMERLDGPNLLEMIVASHQAIRAAPAVAASPLRLQHATAEQAGRHLVRMIMLGRYNRDGKPSNLIVLGVPDGPHDFVRSTSTCTSTGVDGSIQIAPIDTVAIRRATSRHPHALEEMLAHLFIEPLGCRVPPRRTLCWRVVRSAADELNRHREASLPKTDYRAAIRHDAKILWKRAASIVTSHGDPTPRVCPVTHNCPSEPRERAER